MVLRSVGFSLTDMTGESLLKLVIAVWSVAATVAVFVGLPALLTADGVEVNATLIVMTFSAIGTVGALIWAVVNGLQLRREAEADRRKTEATEAAAVAEKRIDQARRVCGWITRAGLTEHQLMLHPYTHRVLLSNTSAEPVYELVAYLVWVQGAAPRTGEQLQMEPHTPIRGIRAIVQVLPPGNYQLILEGPSNQPMQGQLGLEIAFTDAAGRSWIRRVPSGELNELTVGPVKHYNIGRPLQYHQIEPWATTMA